MSNLVFSSSAAVYGETVQLPITEDAHIRPISPYGVAKQLGEIVIRDTVAASQSLRSVALHYFNVIGAHSSAKIGEPQIGTPTGIIPLL